VAEILQQCRIGANRDVDLDTQFHHCFWLGDLNYRLDFSITDPTEPPSKEEAHRRVAKAVEEEDWEALLAADQLRESQRRGSAFVGFCEAPITFPPTFKVERCPGFTYKAKRVPSYCDRVLWRSLPGYAKDVHCTQYSTFPEIGTSDHKPVAAAFEVTVRAVRGIVSKHTKQEAGKIVIHSLAGHGLVASDMDGKSDPYVRFVTDPPRGLVPPAKRGWGGAGHVATRYRPKTLDPVWEHRDIPMLRTHGTHGYQLRQSHLFMCVYDHDPVSGDDPMGTAVVWLGDFLGSEPAEFDVPVVRWGKAVGRLSGTAHVLLPVNKLHKIGTQPKLAMNHSGGSKCCGSGNCVLM
jgi:hypothetical protein